jgi:hypothetical protein
MYITTSEKIEKIDIKDKIINISFKILLNPNEEKNFTIEMGTSKNLSDFEITKNVDEKFVYN